MPKTKTSRRAPAQSGAARMAHARKFREYRPSLPLAMAIAGNIDRPVNSEQLAEHLQISTRTLAAWRGEGKIPFWRINPRNFRYRIRDVETALSNAR